MSSKPALRRALLAARRARPDADRLADAAALAAAVGDVLGEPGPPVCLHVPVRREPGCRPDGSVPLLDAALALGHRVLLPVTVGAAPLDWAHHRGSTDLVAGPHGLAEPAGPRLGPGAIGDAAVIVVPALAVARDGARLGRGGGHYDRSLALAPGSRVVALVGDDELLDALPADPHDVRVAAVWRPATGLTALGDGTP